MPINSLRELKCHELVIIAGAVTPTGTDFLRVPGNLIDLVAINLAAAGHSHPIANATGEHQHATDQT